MQSLSGHQRPDLLTSLINMSLALRLPRKMHLCRSSSNVPHLPSCLEMLRKPSRFAHVWQGAQSPAPATRKHTWIPKVVQTPNAFNMLTSKCALRHKRVHFFNIATSKSGPELKCFARFDFEMCFAPKQCALFQHHRNFQKWSGPGVFSTFWLRNVLRAKTACIFSTSQLPKVVRTCSAFSFFTCKCASHHSTACTFSTSQLPSVVRSKSALYILTSKCASRHNGVHFFDISTSKSGPNLVCFVKFDFEMCFAPQRRALFRHLNFQKWSGPGVFLCILTSKCASHHNGVHFFDISTAKSGPEQRCFVHFDFKNLQNVLRARTACNFSSLIWPDGSAPGALASLLFDPLEPQIIGKTPCFATFLPFRAPASSFFWLVLFSDLLSSTLLFSLTLPISSFHLSILSEVWLLNFLRICKLIKLNYSIYNIDLKHMI